MSNYGMVIESIEDLVGQIIEMSTERRNGDAFKIGLKEQYEIPFYYGDDFIMLKWEEAKNRPLFHTVKPKVRLGEWAVFSARDYRIKNMLEKLHGKQ